MDTIRAYIESLFRGLPDTVDVRRARAELLQMSEDRYHELRDQGLGDHEAVGRVITQFGNLDDIADDLGIRGVVDAAEAPEAAVEFTTEDADRFLRVRRRGSILIAAGIVSVLTGVGLLTFMSDGSGDNSPLALAVLFLGVAIGVVCFIVGGLSMNRYERLEGRKIRLVGAASATFQQVREREQTAFIASIAGGVFLLIAAVGGFAIIQSATPGDGAGDWALLPMMIAIGLGVGVIVVGGMRRGALDQLTGNGDYEHTDDEEPSLIGRIAGPYWMLAVVVYLAWSFIGNAWGQSWMVWPIAGVLFGLVAATVTAFTNSKGRR